MVNDKFFNNIICACTVTFGAISANGSLGTAGQVLVTDGSNTISFANNTDITGKTDRADFNAHVAVAVTTNANYQPAINNLYSIGNSTAKYSQIFSTYFRGTADLAVNAQNLGSVPAANFAQAGDVYTKAETKAAH